jgi:hypothetical protein
MPRCSGGSFADKSSGKTNENGAVMEFSILFSIRQLLQRLHPAVLEIVVHARL